MLNLMYITNDPAVALIAQRAGVQRIFVDRESLWKAERQGGMDTVQSAHTIRDIEGVREVLTTSDLLVRINPIHENVPGYTDSKYEINAVIKAGADAIMLPYFKTAEEVQTFLELVDGRTKTVLLLETKEAANPAELERILSLPGIDEMFIGLNDLSISYQNKFMFEPLANGTVERLTQSFTRAGLPFGFGGIASLGKGMLPSENIIREHYRLGSRSVILSRSFCDVNKVRDLEVIEVIFNNGVQAIRDFEAICERYLTENNRSYFEANQREVAHCVSLVLEARG